MPLGEAMDLVLRLNGFGMIPEDGLYRIVDYPTAAAAKRQNRVINLENADAQEVKTTLDTILATTPGSEMVAIAANPGTNILIISGPGRQVEELTALAYELDIAEPTLPTETTAIKLNYAEPVEVAPMVAAMLTPEVGQVAEDPRGRHLIITDAPAVIKQVRQVVEQIDRPVKQVSIQAMIVDAVLRDASQTGVDWLLALVRRVNTRGDVVSDLKRMRLDSSLGNAIGTDALDAGVLNFLIFNEDIRLDALIAAEVQSRNADILARPSVVTVENKEAEINIVQEFPYQEITQSTQGPPVATTEFKPIGVSLMVTPRVTHEDDIIVDVEAKESSVSGLTEDGIPIEDKRLARTTLLTNNGKTIFIGGLRNISDRVDVSKIPLLGDVPVVNFMFRSTDIEKIHTELMVFLTCHVLGEEPPPLTPRQEHEFNRLDGVPQVPNSQPDMIDSFAHPGDMRDPIWKYRRSN
jgi:type II secretory pathway component GspD/PulD (secretin)